ncbi:MAG: PA3496 family putative envelope integrity protein [Pseudomonadota bacterium]
MAKNQARQEPAVEEPDVWLAEEGGDFEEAANDSTVSAPPKARLVTRHKIEDLIESRRLKKQISDYEFLDLDDSQARDKGPRRVH